MARIETRDLGVEFPLLQGDSRSLKRQLSDSLRLRRFGLDQRNRTVLKALQGVNLQFRDGDRVAVIGPNGAGKSTLLRVLAGIYPPTAGYCRVEGTVGALLTVGLGMRDDVSGYDNIRFGLLFLGMHPNAIEEKAREVAEFTGLSDYLYMHVGAYSSGMRTRLAFGIATAIDPDILILDEVFGAGDSAFLKKAEARIMRLIDRSKILVFASHSTDMITRFCSKAIWLENGELKQFGDAEEVSEAYEASVQ